MRIDSKCLSTCNPVKPKSQTAMRGERGGCGVLKERADLWNRNLVRSQRVAGPKDFCDASGRLVIMFSDLGIPCVPKLHSTLHVGPRIRWGTPQCGTAWCGSGTHLRSSCFFCGADCLKTASAQRGTHASQKPCANCKGGFWVRGANLGATSRKRFFKGLKTD